jgi:hypothetical protein
VYTNQGEQDQVENTIQFAKTATSDQLIPQLQRVISELRLKFGTWEIEWGTIIVFKDRMETSTYNIMMLGESLPVAFGPAIWEVYPLQKQAIKTVVKRYGSNGNSFVCAEFE